MGQDKDPGAGKFSLEGLPWGSYELKELNPPAGYIASTTVYKFTVNNQKQEGFALAGTTGNKITNEINETPRLPLTGGYGIYLPIGLGMLLMLVGARRLQVQNS